MNINKHLISLSWLILQFIGLCISESSLITDFAHLHSFSVSFEFVYAEHQSPGWLCAGLVLQACLHHVTRCSV